MSAGLQLPVIAVIILDKESKQYFTSLTSHTSLPIAVEKAITEVFQGRSFAELKDTMTSISS